MDQKNKQKIETHDFIYVNSDLTHLNINTNSLT